MVKEGVFAAGLNLTRQTRSEEAGQFIGTLRPFDCEKGLIRIGGEADGGYLLPNDLEGMEYCFSPGVGTVSDFENHLSTLHIKSFLADYSVESPPVQNPDFVFDQKFLGANDSDIFMTLILGKRNT